MNRVTNVVLVDANGPDRTAFAAVWRARTETPLEMFPSWEPARRCLDELRRGWGDMGAPLLIVDPVGLRDWDISLVAALRENPPGAWFASVIVTRDPTPRLRRHAQQVAATDCLFKPPAGAPFDDLARIIERYWLRTIIVPA